jgi:hypothetical protein
VSFVLGAGSFFVYFFTMSGYVGIGDAGEIATAVYTWGIAHPTGFPLYIILAKMFSYLLPMFEFARRLNIFSALCAAGTVVSVFFICRKININKWAAVAGALSLAFGYTFWTHAQTINTYSFTALLFSLAILLWLDFYETKKTARLYFLSILCGLGAGGHLTFFLIFPFIAAHWIFSKKDFRPQIKISVLFRCFLCFVFFCLLVYSYIPLRAAKEPALNWGNPSTPGFFAHYIFQFDYSDKMANRSVDGWVAVFGEAWRLYSREMTALGLMLAIAGAVILRKKERGFFYGGMVAIVFNVLLMGNYGDSRDLHILYRYFLPGYVVLSVFLAAALSAFFNRLLAKFQWTGALFLLLPATILITHFGDLNNRDNILIKNAIDDIFVSVPEKNMVFISGDSLIGAAMYKQIVLKERTDVVAISDKLYTHPWYLEAKKKELEKNNLKFVNDAYYLARENAGKVYSVSNILPALKTDYSFFPIGVVYGVYPKGEEPDAAALRAKAKNFWQNKELGFLEEDKFFKNPVTQEIVHIYTAGLNNLAAQYVNTGRVQEGVNYYIMSLDIKENENALRNLAGIYDALGNPIKAMEYQRRLDAFE